MVVFKTAEPKQPDCTDFAIRRGRVEIFLRISSYTTSCPFSPVGTWTSTKPESHFKRQSDTGAIGRYSSHISRPSFEPTDTSNAVLARVPDTERGKVSVLESVEPPSQHISDEIQRASSIPPSPGPATDNATPLSKLDAPVEDPTPDEDEDLVVRPSPRPICKHPPSSSDFTREAPKSPTCCCRARQRWRGDVIRHEH
ncbi:hypothetical protein EI94DRAFT_1197736 [Lactarius quietus]|nr:hypothetical protein EI94DRAFT_1197736 [Lactarius quietus]